MNKDSGKIIALPQFESGTTAAGKEWRKQDVCIEWGDKYKNQLCVTFFGDKMSMLEKLSVGDAVTVEYNTNSRSYTKDGKTGWFTSANGFKIDFDLDGGNAVIKLNEAANYASDANDLPF